MNEEIKFSQESILYRPKQQNVYPILEHDWKKIRKAVDECNTKSGVSFKDIALVLIGGGVSAFLSLIALYNSEKVAVWVMNANWIVLICTLVIGVAFLVMGGFQKNMIERDIKSIIRDMEDVESKFHTPPENLNTDSANSNVSNNIIYGTDIAGTFVVRK